jgi:hypothetical protein
MLARDVNYVGLGVARRGSRVTYTAIFTRCRDKTEPRVVIEEATWRASEEGLAVAIDWQGHDPELAVGTAGIERYEVQRFSVPDGWGDVAADPRRSEFALPAPGTRDEHLRIRAVDKAGNIGPWAYTRLRMSKRLARGEGGVGYLTVAVSQAAGPVGPSTGTLQSSLRRQRPGRRTGQEQEPQP